MDELSVYDRRSGSLKESVSVETARVVGYGRWYDLPSTLFVTCCHLLKPNKTVVFMITLYFKVPIFPSSTLSESILSVTLRLAFSSILPKHEKWDSLDKPFIGTRSSSTTPPLLNDSTLSDERRLVSCKLTEKSCQEEPAFCFQAFLSRCIPSSTDTRFISNIINMLRLILLCCWLFFMWWYHSRTYPNDPCTSSTDSPCPRTSLCHRHYAASFPSLTCYRKWEQEFQVICNKHYVYC